MAKQAYRTSSIQTWQRLGTDRGGSIDEEDIVALVIILGPLQLNVVEVWQLIFACLLDGILQPARMNITQRQ